VILPLLVKCGGTAADDIVKIENTKKSIDINAKFFE
jgi:hypothetical protein